jgi:SecD/SecF fusion protein
MREEHRAGAGLRLSLERGFTKAFSAIVDSNITTLLAAGLLPAAWALAGRREG